MSKSLKKILNAVSTVLVVLVVILALLLVGARIVGLQVFTVLSGSMEPTYHVGALIYVKKTAPEDIQAGDVITFMLNETTTATHRVVAVVPDDEDPGILRYQTKGDANDHADASLVHMNNVIGEPVFSISCFDVAITMVNTDDVNSVFVFHLMFLSKFRFSHIYLTSPPCALDSSDAR